MTDVNNILNSYLYSGTNSLTGNSGVSSLIQSGLTEGTKSTNSTSFNSEMQSQLLVSMFSEMMKGSGDFSKIMTSLIQAYASNGTLDVSKIAGNNTNASFKYNPINVSDIVSSKMTSTGNMTIDEAIQKASKKYGVDADFIKALIKAESSFNPNAVSSANCVGLMQLSPQNEQYQELSNPFDIEQNVDGGTKFLKGLLDSYGQNKQLALAAYNAGPGAVNRSNVANTGDYSRLPKETQNYVPKVMSYYNQYKNGTLV
ncbi:lytic transglycosylase domain-containing protein [Clostridium cellulovorans]|uniref:Lytic transglycosylase catalytic n=1 Tax=Clostridium cellulovorans (strain ATCC 35296 / DSM 3052 / OCM 3 / 743B) TaxID=573061 RepID=D9SVJ8_CLOC7|nr:lytic transglycosylase domain-containing protein [Clostridium cellulovorans]ADL51122.1 Lytic transglycosylase catalytic [Clostridium cellulovorans 743B]